jgi:hypothetical protein
MDVGPVGGRLWSATGPARAGRAEVSLREGAGVNLRLLVFAAPP